MTEEKGPMQEPGVDHSRLFASVELAAHIVDTLVDHGVIDKARSNEALTSVKWELDAHFAMGRIILKR
jgi:hypothetical protein